jgi:uncharacterized membrane protein YccC
VVVPVHIWAYALRVVLDAVVALYLAFWLQLGAAAAVSVVILSLTTRGATVAKAVKRFVATFIGATMSIAIASRMGVAFA